MTELKRIPIARPVVGQTEKRKVLEALDSGWVSSVGPYVAEFERAFAAYCGVRHAVSAANGTLALHLALRILGVGEGDEVLIPAMTFIAVPNAVRYLGARPVLVDCDPDTWCIDPALLEQSVSPRTRALIAVHSYGGVCDMDALIAVASRHGFPIIEDAAEAHGATYAGKRVGGLGRIGVFSFYGNKIITTGEGGMLTTDDGDLAERAAFLKDHGMSRVHRYLHPEVGYNYRMTSLQAALGSAQLDQIDGFLAARDRIAARYRERLAAVPGISFQAFSPRSTGVCWLFSALVSEPFPLLRDDLILRLADRGIETRPFFVSINEQPPYAESGSYPVAERLSRQGINLPTASDLTPDEVDRVCDSIAAIAGEAR